MDMLGWTLRGFLVLTCALIGLGTGLCSVTFLPTILDGLFHGRSQEGGGTAFLLLINLLGFAIAAGCVYLIIMVVKDRRKPKPIVRYESGEDPARDSDSAPPPA
jgi:hypothetical protein